MGLAASAWLMTQKLKNMTRIFEKLFIMVVHYK
jgi:hypothetical protein